MKSYFGTKEPSMARDLGASSAIQSFAQLADTIQIYITKQLSAIEGLTSESSTVATGMNELR
jgi:hypothetical protein